VLFTGITGLDIFTEIMQKLAGILMLASLAFASDVVEFTDSNFDQVNDYDVILVEFYAPW